MIFRKRIENFNNDLQAIEKANTGMLKISQEAITLCRQVLSDLKGLVSSEGFGNQEEEIEFFKNLKSLPLSYLIYYLKVYAIESKISKLGSKTRNKVLNKQMNKTYGFLMGQIDFVNYAEQEQTHLDMVYFTRSQSVQIMMFDTEDYFYDLDFNTSYDTLFAKIKAYSRLRDYLEHRLKPKACHSDGTKLQWTSSKTALTELVYALYHSRVVNNGNLEIKDLALELQHVFNFDLGDFYKTYAEIRSRKQNRTKFLDELSYRLNHEMELKDY